MKKVLFVIETLRGGGAERALSNIVTHFPSDWHIDILVNDRSLIEYSYKGNMLTLSLPEGRSPIYFIRCLIKRMFYLMIIKKTNQYDACVSFLEGPNISNILSGKRYCKTIVSIRGGIMPEKSGLYEKVRDFLLIKILYSRADLITAVSEEIALKLINQLKIPEKKVQAIVNGYDCGLIHREMERYPLKGRIRENFCISDYKVIVSAGRMVKKKGQWHLIRAFSDLVKREPRAVLFIIGEGPLREYLEEVISLYDLKGKVFLPGRSDNPFWFYGKADVFVLPSLSEGYPNVLAEAVCCGAPCVATDIHSGPREILASDFDITRGRVNEISEEEYGILVPACSGKKYSGNEPLEPEELMMAEAILMLLNDNDKRQYYRKKSIERSRDLDISTIVDKWINVISGDMVRD